MNHTIYKDLKKRKLFVKTEFKQKRLKTLLANQTLPKDELYQIFINLNKLPRNGAKTRIKNRCIITGRAHSVYKKFKLSRLMLRQLISIENGITGVIKDSW